MASPFARAIPKATVQMLKSIMPLARKLKRSRASESLTAQKQMQRPLKRLRREEKKLVQEESNQVDSKHSLVTAQPIMAPLPTTYKLKSLGINLPSRFTLSYVGGYVYVGNGTLGQAAQVYWTDPTLAYIASVNTGIGQQVPIVPQDVVFGTTYAIDLFKHFQTVTYHKIKLSFIPQQPNVTTNCQIFVAPFRGSTGICTAATGAGAPVNPASLYSCAGIQEFASYQPAELNLTPYIFGGYGPRGNQFNVHTNFNTNTVSGVASNEGLGVVPCTYAIGGIVTGTAALNGGLVSTVIVEMDVTLTDWVGAYTNGDLGDPFQPEFKAKEKPKLSFRDPVYQVIRGSEVIYQDSKLPSEVKANDKVLRRIPIKGSVTSVVEPVPEFVCDHKDEQGDYVMAGASILPPPLLPTSAHSSYNIRRPPSLCSAVIPDSGVKKQ